MERKKIIVSIITKDGDKVITKKYDNGLEYEADKFIEGAVFRYGCYAIIEADDEEEIECTETMMSI